MWRVINKTCGQSLEVEQNSWISVGNLDECEVFVEKIPKNTLLCQIFFDDLFAFQVVCGQPRVFFKNDRLNAHGLFLMFECRLKNHISDLVKPNVKTLSALFRSSDFLNTLQHVHENMGGHVLSSSGSEVEAVLQKACEFLSRSFWQENRIFDVDKREKFKEIIWAIWAQIFDYGLLAYPLADHSISEVMVNEVDAIYFEKHGKLVLSELSFSSQKDIFSLIERMVHAAGRRIDESKPYCDARLKDGSRIHAIIPPVSINGPCLTVRKFSKHPMTPQILLENGSFPEFLFESLKSFVQNKKNILISGGTGSGKTTLLNCLSAFIPEGERIITIEDSAELRLQQPHVIRLECRNENVENKGQISIRDLLKNTLRMRPDRIIIGECRGAEALDMLQAMNTGHDGSMATIHANSPLDALRRLETLVLFSQLDLPSRAIREQICSAVQYVVHQSRLHNGRRCVTHVCAVEGLCAHTNTFILDEVYRFSDVQEAG